MSLKTSFKFNLKKLTLALLTAIPLAAAQANPEAEGNRSSSLKAQSVLLVRKEPNGTKKYFRISKKVSPADVPAVIEDFHATPEEKARKFRRKEVDLSKYVVEVPAAEVVVKNNSKSKNIEAESTQAKQSWWFQCGRFVCGTVGYYPAQWPVYTGWAGYGGYYGYSYPCHNFNYSVYWPTATPYYY